MQINLNLTIAQLAKTKNVSIKVAAGITDYTVGLFILIDAELA